MNEKLTPEQEELAVSRFRACLLGRLEELIGDEWFPTCLKDTDMESIHTDIFRIAPERLTMMEAMDRCESEKDLYRSCINPEWTLRYNPSNWIYFIKDSNTKQRIPPHSVRHSVWVREETT